MASSDRLTGPLRAIARRADPLLPFRSLYRARLVSQSGDLARVDVIPEETDGLLPPMSNVPLRTGTPGVSARVRPGAYLLVGWENGKPSRPFAALWSSPSTTGGSDALGDSGGGGGDVLELVLNAEATITMGANQLVPPLNGVLTGESIDVFTGKPHWSLGNASMTVLAKNK